METMKQYVIRKLREKGVKVNQVAILSKVTLRTIYNILEGKDALYSNIEKLNDYFKHAAD